MNLILFGFKGCGKTHFGKRVSEKTGRLFYDSDDIIYAQNGRSCRELYLVEGAAAFRRLETEALHSLRAVQNAIIAVGGGAVLDPKNVIFLQHLGVLVYLKASEQKLKERVLQMGVPAFLDKDNIDTSFHMIFRERVCVYEQIPAACIDTDALDETEIVEKLYGL